MSRTCEQAEETLLCFATELGHLGVYGVMTAAEFEAHDAVADTDLVCRFSFASEKSKC